LEIIKQNFFNAVSVKEYQNIHTVIHINARLYNLISIKAFCNIGYFFVCLLYFSLVYKVKENPNKTPKLFWKWACISELNVLTHDQRNTLGE